MYRSKVIAAIVISFTIVISSAAIASFIGHRLYPVETIENSKSQFPKN